MTTIIPRDMPKLESPFIRKEINGAFVVTPEVNPGYEWVFEDPSVRATEKLDGTDVSVVVGEGHILSVWNRENRIIPFDPQFRHIINAILNSAEQHYIDLPDGQWFGEAIGPSIQGNPYRLDKPIWLPFRTYVARKFSYNSWGKYPKTYEAISEWFKTGPMSLIRLTWFSDKAALAEGIVFHHPDGRMAKLRRDMFPWFEGPRHNQDTKP